MMVRNIAFFVLHTVNIKNSDIWMQLDYETSFYILHVDKLKLTS